MATLRKLTHTEQSPTKEKQKQISRKASHPTLWLSGSLRANSNRAYQSAFAGWLAWWPPGPAQGSAGFLGRDGGTIRTSTSSYPRLTHLSRHPWKHHLSVCRDFWNLEYSCDAKLASACKHLHSEINLIVRLKHKVKN